MKSNKQIFFNAQELITSLKGHAEPLKKEIEESRKAINCPDCDKPLKLVISSFEQYEPSTYYCQFCAKDFSVEFIMGYLKCLNNVRNKKENLTKSKN